MYYENKLFVILILLLNVHSGICTKHQAEV